MFDFNTLTWFLYLADILVNIKHTITAGSLVFITAVSIGWFASWCAEDPITRIKIPVIITCVCGFLLLMVSFIPSETTMYRMAASEAGEMVVKDEYTQEILEDLKEVIKHQLNSLKGN